MTEARREFIEKLFARPLIVDGRPMTVADFLSRPGLPSPDILDVTRAVARDLR